MIAGIADHGVAGGQQRREAADVGLVAGREGQRVLGPHPVAELALELQMKRDRPVEEARARQRGPVLVEGAPRGVLHSRVAGQAEVVVGAEHHPLGALHLHDRPGLALEQAEVGHHVLLARRAQQLDALVSARLLEEVGNGPRHQE